MDSTRFLVVGGGITGLAFANFVRAPSSEWLLLERDDEPGGYCRTVLRDGFVWDYSGHFFHFRDPKVERMLVTRMPPGEVETIRKSSGILFEGTRVDFPFQKNIHQLPREDFIDCLYDLFFRDELFRDENLRGEASRGDGGAGQSRSFRDMLYSRLGRGIAERFLAPYNEKLYACQLDRLDEDAMGRFFPHADIADIIRNFKHPGAGGYNATFTYPRGGAVEYVKALLRDLPAENICCGEEVIAVDPERKIATTARKDGPGRPIRYEHLVSSMPFVRLLETAGVAYERSAYTWNKVLVFNLGFDRKGQSRDHWLYVPSRDVSFYRVGFYDNIFGADRMSLYVEIGAPPELDLTGTQGWLERVIRDLRSLGLVTDHELVSWHSVVLDPAYVHINGASRRDFAEKSAWLAERGIHTAGRYGAWTYCSIEDNIVEARELAAALG